MYCYIAKLADDFKNSLLIRYIEGTSSSDNGISTVTFLNISRLFYFVIDKGQVNQILVTHYNTDASINILPTNANLTVVSVNKLTVTFSNFQWWYTPKFFY